LEEITELLIKRAKQARENSYAPYSKFKVGAAVLNSDGEVYIGCNIENASYGLSNCAERTAIFKAVSNGKRELKAIAIVADVEQGLCMPCGACRQVMVEFMDKEGVVICANTNGDYKVYSVEDMLPGAFTGRSLNGGMDDVVINKTDIPTI
jgi:cytidine deaminase